MPQQSLVDLVKKVNASFCRSLSVEYGVVSVPEWTGDLMYPFQRIVPIREGDEYGSRRDVLLVECYNAVKTAHRPTSSIGVYIYLKNPNIFFSGGEIASIAKPIGIVVLDYLQMLREACQQNGDALNLSFIGSSSKEGYDVNTTIGYLLSRKAKITEQQSISFSKCLIN